MHAARVAENAEAEPAVVLARVLEGAAASIARVGALVGQERAELGRDRQLGGECTKTRVERHYVYVLCAPISYCADSSMGRNQESKFSGLNSY